MTGNSSNSLPTIDGVQILRGDCARFEQLRATQQAQNIDLARPVPEGWQPPQFCTTVVKCGQVACHGTYDGRKERVLRFAPAPAGSGWQIRRNDLLGQYPIAVSLRSLASANRAFILRSGADNNRFRMAEHVVCQRLGLGLSDLLIECDSEDPPLFDCGSQPLVEALQQAGITTTDTPLRYCTVTSPVAMLNPADRGFLLWEPAHEGDRTLTLDVAIDFPTAIGQQRLLLGVCPENFTFGACARTNCSAREFALLQRFHWLSKDWRHTGYNARNILAAGSSHYVNAPLTQLTMDNGKPLEAVWHRSCLDLIAALSLLPMRPAGRITSYCAGHVLDCEFFAALELSGRLIYF